MKNLKSKEAKLGLAVIAVLVLIGIGMAYQMNSSTAPAPEEMATTTPTGTQTTPKAPAPAASVTNPSTNTNPDQQVSIVSRTYRPNDWAIAFNLPTGWNAQPTADAKGNVTRVTIGDSDETMMVSKDVQIAVPAKGSSKTLRESIFGKSTLITVFGTTSYFSVKQGASTYYFRTESTRENPEYFIAILEDVTVTP